MGFFKDFKEDFNDAVNELVPGGDAGASEEVMVNTLDGDIDVESELNKLDGLLEQVSKKVDEPSTKTNETTSTQEQSGERKSFFSETKKETKMEASKGMDVMGNASAFFSKELVKVVPPRTSSAAVLSIFFNFLIPIALFNSRII